MLEDDPGTASSARVSLGSAVRGHLVEILASPGFVRSKRLAAFLEFVVDRALLGETASLTERAIAIAVYQRASDFDPKLDGTVRAEAMRLRHKLREYYESGPQPHPRIEIPKGGYAPVFVGFVPARPAGATPSRHRRFLGAASAVVFTAILASISVIWFRPGHSVTSALAETRRLRLIGDNIPALASADRAVAIAPRSSEAHLERAAVLENLGHDLEARSEALRAWELAGKDNSAIVARFSRLDSDWRKSADTLQPIIARDPDSLDLRMQLAEAQIDGGQADSLSTIAIARRLPGGSNNPEVDRLEGLALAIQRKPAAGLQMVLQGERTAETLHAWSSLARLIVLEGGLWQINGNYARAAVALDRARNLCQSVHDDICVARTYRVDGNRLTCTGQYWRATAVFEKALAIARQWENWPEISKLQQGMDAALEGLGNAYPPLSIGISPPFSKPPARVNPERSPFIPAACR